MKKNKISILIIGLFLSINCFSQQYDTIIHQGEKIIGHVEIISSNGFDKIFLTKEGELNGNFYPVKNTEIRRYKLPKDRINSGDASINGIKLKDIKVPYIEIVGYGKFLSNKCSITINFGQELKLFDSLDKKIIKDKYGNIIDFNSMIDALNFMYRNGYELKDTYLITHGNQNVYHYILKIKE